MSDELRIAIITAILSPFALRSLEYVYSLYGDNRKTLLQKEESEMKQRRAEEEMYNSKIDNLNQKMDGMRKDYDKKIADAEFRYRSDMEILRNVNIELRVQIAKFEAILVIKEETIQRLSTEIEQVRKKLHLGAAEKNSAS